ncbi:protein SCO1/2 [Alteribacillus persepolensis]|uniref:Protein SCO1/2 n=1 Tax=Alteribacillus persepolensis TaxID=568899 RepID=A0A1G8H3U0_9BACI|nr:SCO family protein [Alteribacillus persepolensis]SDI01170.1 protein SCO1/2 [Alteribacillus persepolensis]
MRKYNSMFVVAAVCLLLSGCAWLYETGQSAENGTDLTDAKLQVPSFSFTNQDEEVVTKEDLQGQYWLADMIFTRCPDVCGLMTPNMVNVQEEINKEDLNVQFVSFSVDPEFDTPDRLKNYGENYGADFDNWHFLTGYSDEEIQTLSQEAFSSPVEKVPEQNNVIHSTKFFLIDPDGNVIRSYDGLENDIAPLAEDMKQLASSSS